MLKLRTRPHPDTGVAGTVRADRRTGTLLPRLRAGDIAVLDQVDLDGPTAEALVDARVAAVVNRAPMISGRFPNRGPQLLLEAGISMVDLASGVEGKDLFAAVSDGRQVSLSMRCSKWPETGFVSTWRRSFNGKSWADNGAAPRHMATTAIIRP